MEKEKKVIVVSEGDPFSPNTWSNVPYFVVNTLKKKGWSIIPVNVFLKFRPLHVVFRFITIVFKSIFNAGALYNYDRTFLFKKWQDNLVKNAVKKHPDVNLLLYISNTPLNLIDVDYPKILLFDFSIEYTIKVLQNRTPSKQEEEFIRWQNTVIQKFDKVFVLFQQATDYYQKNCPEGHFVTIPGYFINCDDLEYNAEEVFRKRCSSNQVLFIGRQHYITGLLCLINAIRAYNREHTGEPLLLNVIGLSLKQVGINESWIHYHGYIDKKTDKKYLLYKLIQDSKVIVNTTKKWGGITSIVESLWFGLPVITSPYEGFCNVFSNCIDFGFYCGPENETELLNKLKQVFEMNDEDYLRLQNNAHKAVKDFTWDSYIDYMLNNVF